MDWKILLAYITGTVAQELLWRNEYLVTESRLLRNQVKGCIRFSHFALTTGIGDRTPFSSLAPRR